MKTRHMQRCSFCRFHSQPGVALASCLIAERHVEAFGMFKKQFVFRARHKLFVHFPFILAIQVHFQSRVVFWLKSHFSRKTEYKFQLTIISRTITTHRPLTPNPPSPTLRGAQSLSPTSVEDVPVPEAEHLAGAVPLLQGRWELRGRDVQVDGHQGDADQTDMDPPLSHLEPSDDGGFVIPTSGYTGRYGGVSQHVKTSTKQSATLAWLEAEVKLSLYKLKLHSEECHAEMQRDKLNDTCCILWPGAQGSHGPPCRTSHIRHNVAIN